MKKQLLLLPLIALSLAGCGRTETNCPVCPTNNSGTESYIDIEPEIPEEKWIEVNSDEHTLFIILTTNYRIDYELSTYSSFQYCDRRNGDYTVLDIKYAYKSTPSKIINNTFIGRNINYVLY